jgi:autophagy-related protein 101
MNARSHTFEITVEERQIEEVVATIFHTLLFHRTQGKYHYKQEGSYSIGSVGMIDVDCDFVDFTYVRAASDELDRLLKKEIALFRDELRSVEGSSSGIISLEFFQKKRMRWPFSPESIPWEVWVLKIDIVTPPNEHERQLLREKVSETLAEKILYIAEVMSKHEYVPKLPSQSDLDLVFDVSFGEVQPYCFKISYQTTMSSSASVSTTVRKLIKDTLAI